MTIIVYIWLALSRPPALAEVDALVATAPDYLDRTSAEIVLLAAESAGAVYRVDPAILLSIAYHESRYVRTTVTPEPGGRVSCGVMTPVPQRSCSDWELTVIGGFEAGAAHVALWRSLLPGLELYAYAGGGWLAGLCAKDRKAQECRVVDQFVRRAEWIRSSLRKARRKI